MSHLPLSNTVEYLVRYNLNLYDSIKCDRLATQAAVGRHLRVLVSPTTSGGMGEGNAIEVRLCEDDYPGWLALTDVDSLEVASTRYHPKTVSDAEIREKIPDIIAFTHHAMNQTNEYLWGGTVSPNYDCSGLIQAAFQSVGIWLPRDAYQQEDFVQKIEITELQPGDLVFFGTPQKATHVGLYLGDGRYIHSSGKDQGRNGIGIDILAETGDKISQTYYHQLRGVGRVVASY
jgi:cell wall-associated NlpC family hydrolase